MNNKNKEENFGKFDFDFKGEAATDNKQESSAFNFSDFAREEKFVGELKDIKEKVKDNYFANDDEVLENNKNDISDDNSLENKTDFSDHNMFSFDKWDDDDYDYIIESMDDYDNISDKKDEIETLDLEEIDYASYNDDVDFDRDDFAINESSDNDYNRFSDEVSTPEGVNDSDNSEINNNQDNDSNETNYDDYNRFSDEVSTPEGVNDSDNSEINNNQDNDSNRTSYDDYNRFSDEVSTSEGVNDSDNSETNNNQDNDSNGTSYDDYNRFSDEVSAPEEVNDSDNSETNNNQDNDSNGTSYDDYNRFSDEIVSVPERVNDSIDNNEDNNSNGLNYNDHYNSFNDESTSKRVNSGNDLVINNPFIKNKIYISFEERVAISILIVVVLFLSSCFLMFKAVTFSRPQKVSYKESSDVNYSVCLDNNDFYNQSCINENMKYISELTNKIDTTFKYNVSFSEDVEYDFSYHVVGVTKINDGVNPEQSLYENEELLVEKTNVANTKDSVNIETNVLIDYKRFNSYVTEYKKRYALNAIATLEVILYLDEPQETRKVASIVIPLNEDTYFINKNLITGKNKIVEIEGKMWNIHTVICAIFAILSIVIALIILFKTTSLVLKVTSKKNNYQNMLNQILTEYDSMIVIARNGYVSNVEKQIIKVDSFKELLDAKENLGKPIIYSKINNVKSEFIVEDVEVLYKFVLKEADLEDE